MSDVKESDDDLTTAYMVGYEKGKDAVSRERDEALDALEAFAKMAAHFDLRGNKPTLRPHKDDDEIYTISAYVDLKPATITVGDLRRAEAILRKHNRLPAAGGAE